MKIKITPLLLSLSLVFNSAAPAFAQDFGKYNPDAFIDMLNQTGKKMLEEKAKDPFNQLLPLPGDQFKPGFGNNQMKLAWLRYEQAVSSANPPDEYYKTPYEMKQLLETEVNKILKALPQSPAYKKAMRTKEIINYVEEGVVAVLSFAIIAALQYVGVPANATASGLAATETALAGATALSAGRSMASYVLVFAFVYCSSGVISSMYEHLTDRLIKYRKKFLANTDTAVNYAYLTPNQAVMDETMLQGWESRPKINLPSIEELQRRAFNTAVPVDNTKVHINKPLYVLQREQEERRKQEAEQAVQAPMPPEFKLRGARWRDRAARKDVTVKLMALRYINAYLTYDASPTKYDMALLDLLSLLSSEAAVSFDESTFTVEKVEYGEVSVIRNSDTIKLRPGRLITRTPQLKAALEEIYKL